MKKSPKQRSDEDSKYLADAFHSIKFFIEAHEEIPEDLILKLYKELSHTFCLKRDKIFQIGDIGNKFYIILKGSVYVLLQKTGFRENVEESIEENNEDKFSNEEFKLIDDIISMNDIEKDGPFPNVENPKKIQALDYLKMQLHEFEKNYSKLTYCDKDNSTISKYVKKLWSLDSTSSNVNFSDDRIRFQSDFLNILNDKDYLSLLYPEMILSKELFTGDSFGELALRRSIPRLKNFSWER